MEAAPVTTAVGRASRRPRVAVVQGFVPPFREGFHSGLRETLDQRGIDYTLVYGKPVGEAAQKDAWVHIPWAHFVDHRIVPVGSRMLTWQPCLDLVRGADLVVVQQASSCLLNYLLWARYLTGSQRLALWGHGRNFQASAASGVGEFVKRQMSRRVHWWFAYNDLSASVVRDLGFPDERITRVQNAIDTAPLVDMRRRMTPDEATALRERLGISGRHIGIYVGGLYAEKRVPYLLESLHEVRRRVPDFEAVLMGAGPDADLVRAAAEANPWIHYVGPRYDEDKARHVLLGQVFLLPGLVGLAVVDSFALEVPMVTVADSQHSPEISYLRDGENGVMLPAGATPAAYAQRVAQVLLDESLRARLVAGCRRAAGIYTMEAMVANFADGIEQAIKA